MKHTLPVFIGTFAAVACVSLWFHSQGYDEPVARATLVVILGKLMDAEIRERRKEAPDAH